MAITINGTGTIDGINVGGLNDGVITNAEIADSTITNTKIANSTIELAKFSSTTLSTTCRAWANFSILAQTTRSSYNISSITYGGVGFSGLCTITFTSALPDANYVVVVSGSRLLGTVPTVVTFPGNAAPTANGFTLWGFANTTTSIAASGSIEYVSFAVFR